MDGIPTAAYFHSCGRVAACLFGLDLSGGADQRILDLHRLYLNLRSAHGLDPTEDAS